MKNSMDINNKGVYLALGTAFISGFAVFMNKFAVGFWESSSVFITAKNIIVALLLTSVLVLFYKLKELKSLSKKEWEKLLIIGFVGGSIPFLLFFKGLSMTAATNAAFLHKTLFIWVALLAIPFLGEKLSKIQFLALAVLLGGVYLFLSPNGFSLGAGELLALGATLLWAIENVIAKHTLKNLSAATVAWGRMFFGSIFLILFLAATNQAAGLLDLTAVKFGWLMISGVILFGYVTTWYSALKHAPATVATSILVLAAPITAILNSIFITRAIPVKIIPATIILIAGALLITKTAGKITEYAKNKISGRPSAV